MNAVVDEFRRLIPPSAQDGSNGWIHFNCPSCRDGKKRFGILFTAGGGFRTRCFNGGCEWEKGPGWEPDSILSYRARTLFEALGGDLSNIPAKFRFPQYRQGGQKPVARIDEGVTKFPAVKLPNDSQLLWDTPTEDTQAVRDYVLSRGKVFRNYPAFVWSPHYSRYVIIPFFYRQTFIGWIGRNIDGKHPVHLKCPNFPTDFMFNQDLIFQYASKCVFIQEGVFDAIALGSDLIAGICTFGNVISKKQIALLKTATKKIVLLPDFKGEEWRSYWQTAKDNNWYLSVPKYPGSTNTPADHIKDFGDSIKRNGLLLTTHVVMNAITRDYGQAKMILEGYSR